MVAPLTPEEMAAFRQKLGLSMPEAPVAMAPAVPESMAYLHPQENAAQQAGVQLPESLRGMPNYALASSGGPSLNVDTTGMREAAPGGAGVAPQPAAEQTSTTAPSPKPIVIPGGMQLASQSIQKGMELPEEVKTAPLAAAGLRAEGADRSEAAGRAQAAYEFGAAQEAMKATEKRNMEMENLQRTKMNVMDAEQEKLRQLNSDVQAGKVPPKTLWGHTTPVASTLAAIGVALGSALQAMNGGSNPALDIINAKVNEGLNQWKLGQAARTDKANQQAAYIKQLEGIYGNREQAVEALRANRLQYVVGQLDAQMAGVKDQQALARGADMRAQLMDQLADAQMKIASVSQDKVHQAWVNRPAQVVGGPGGQKGEFNRKFVGGIGYVDEKAHGEVAKQASYLNTIDKGMDELADLYKQYDFKERLKDSNAAPGFRSAVGSAIRARINILTSQASQAFGSGTPQEAEAIRTFESMGPGGLFADDPTSGLKQMKRITQQQREGVKQAYSAAEGAPQFGYDVKGRPSESANITGEYGKAPVQLKPVK